MADLALGVRARSIGDRTSNSVWQPVRKTVNYCATARHKSPALAEFPEKPLDGFRTGRNNAAAAGTRMNFCGGASLKMMSSLPRSGERPGDSFQQLNLRPPGPEFASDVLSR